MTKHFALNLATAAIVWAWGFTTGRLIAQLLPELRVHRMPAAVSGLDVAGVIAREIGGHA